MWTPGLEQDEGSPGPTMQRAVAAVKPPLWTNLCHLWISSVDLICVICGFHLWTCLRHLWISSVDLICLHLWI